MMAGASRVSDSRRTMDPDEPASKSKPGNGVDVKPGAVSWTPGVVDGPWVPSITTGLVMTSGALRVMTGVVSGGTKAKTISHGHVDEPSASATACRRDPATRASEVFVTVKVSAPDGPAYQTNAALATTSVMSRRAATIRAACEVGAGPPSRTAY